MGVEYSHYLLPRPCSFHPSAEQLTRFVGSLSNDNWIAVPGSIALNKMATIDGMSRVDVDKTWAHIWLPRGYATVPFPLTDEWFRRQLLGDLKLGFRIDHADAIGVRYPFVSDAGPPEDAYYEIQLHLSLEYVHHVSQLIEPAEPVCPCGTTLEYYPDDEIFFASRIKNMCPKCSRTFDPSSIEVVVHDGWTGDTSIVHGGAIYRFAVVIDCGKCIPDRKHDPLRANPELIKLCEQSFGDIFREVADIY